MIQGSDPHPSTLSLYTQWGPSLSLGHCQSGDKAKATLFQGWAHDLNMNHMAYTDVTRTQDCYWFSWVEIGGHPSCNHKGRICLTKKSRFELSQEMAEKWMWSCCFCFYTQVYLKAGLRPLNSSVTWVNKIHFCSSQFN